MLRPSNYPLRTRHQSMSSLACHEASSLPNLPDTTAKAWKAGFKNEWHDAKEIVVPFEDSSFSGLLVSEKEFAAAYAPKRAWPMERLRLETGRTVGRMVDTPIFLQRVGGVTGSFLSVFEKLLMAWTRCCC